MTDVLIGLSIQLVMCRFAWLFGDACRRKSWPFEKLMGGFVLTMSLLNIVCLVSRGMWDF